MVAEARPKKHDNTATVALPVNWVRHVDGFPGGLAVGLLVRLRVSFLTPIDSFHVGSLVG